MEKLKKESYSKLQLDLLDNQEFASLLFGFIRSDSVSFSAAAKSGVL
jgi:hypothetical protein